MTLYGRSASLSGGCCHVQLEPCILQHGQLCSQIQELCNCCQNHWELKMLAQVFHIVSCLDVCRKPTSLIGSDRFLMLLTRFLSLQPSLIHEFFSLHGIFFLGHVHACSCGTFWVCFMCEFFSAYVRFGERATARLAVQHGRWWSGGKNMSGSQVYPRTFGAAVTLQEFGQIHKDCCQHVCRAY